MYDIPSGCLIASANDLTALIASNLASSIGAFMISNTLSSPFTASTTPLSVSTFNNVLRQLPLLWLNTFRYARAPLQTSNDDNINSNETRDITKELKFSCLVGE
jgi:hypothetical protein